MARATSSLPTPLSPRINTVTSLSATRSTMVAMPRMVGALFPEEERPRLIVAETAAKLRDFRDELGLLRRLLERRLERDLAEPSGSSGLTT